MDAKNRLAASQKRQKQLQTTLAQAIADTKKLEPQVAAIAARSYRDGRFTTISMLLNATSPDTFLERAYRLDMIAMLDAQTLKEYRTEVDLTQRAKQAIDLEINEPCAYGPERQPERQLEIWDTIMHEIRSPDYDTSKFEYHCR